jgi:hypothetical protein
MQLTFLGTAAANAYPEAFCGCANCEQTRVLGGPSLRKRSAALGLMRGRLNSTGPGSSVQPIASSAGSRARVTPIERLTSVANSPRRITHSITHTPCFAHKKQLPRLIGLGAVLPLCYAVSLGGEGGIRTLDGIAPIAV